MEVDCGILCTNNWNDDFTRFEIFFSTKYCLSDRSRDFSRSVHLPLTNRHETPFAMTASILEEDAASSSIPRDPSHQTGDTRSTSFHALPAFDHSKFSVEHTRKQSPPCTSGCTSSEVTEKKRTRSRASRGSLDPDRRNARER